MDKYLTEYRDGINFFAGPQISANSQEEAQSIADTIQVTTYTSGRCELVVIGKLILEIEDYELN